MCVLSRQLHRHDRASLLPFCPSTPYCCSATALPSICWRRAIQLPSPCCQWPAELPPSCHQIECAAVELLLLFCCYPPTALLYNGGSPFPLVVHFPFCHWRVSWRHLGHRNSWIGGISSARGRSQTQCSSSYASPAPKEVDEVSSDAFILHLQLHEPWILGFGAWGFLTCSRTAWALDDAATTREGTKINATVHTWTLQSIDATIPSCLLGSNHSKLHGNYGSLRTIQMQTGGWCFLIAVHLTYISN